jgi:hypothetical protein
MSGPPGVTPELAVRAEIGEGELTPGNEIRALAWVTREELTGLEVRNGDDTMRGHILTHLSTRSHRGHPNPDSAGRAREVAARGLCFVQRSIGPGDDRFDRLGEPTGGEPRRAGLTVGHDAAEPFGDLGGHVGGAVEQQQPELLAAQTCEEIFTSHELAPGGGDLAPGDRACR